MSFFLSVFVVFTNNVALSQEYAIGADLSFLKEAEDNGFAFKDNGVAKPAMQIFKDHGYNWIRLRLFHTPLELPNDLKYTLAMAVKAKKMGYKFLCLKTCNRTDQSIWILKGHQGFGFDFFIIISN